jgi:hypothetical protein
MPSNAFSAPYNPMKIDIKTIWITKPEPLKGKLGRQHRLVLHVSQAHVYYASRGGNVVNDFNNAEHCQISDFLNISEFERIPTDAEWKLAQERFTAWIVKNCNSDTKQ